MLVHSRRRLASTWIAVFTATLTVGASLGPATATAVPTTPVISEVMAANATTAFDEDGVASDWIEVHNPTSGPVDLAGWHLTDSPAKPTQFTFPSIVLPPDGYVIVFASKRNQVVGELHADFALSKDGEYVGLLQPDGTVAAEFAPAAPAMATDQSYGIGSDGGIGFLETATPGRANSAVVLAPASTPRLDRAGGYLAGPITVEVTASTEGSELFFTTDGSVPSVVNGTPTDGTILVDSSTTLRVVAVATGYADSAPATATYLVSDEVVAQHGTPPGWPVGPVNGQYLAYGFDPAEAAVHGAEIVAGLAALPTLSIVTDQANLTDPSTGIYVNPGGRGHAWDRPASAELFDAGEAGFQADAQVSIKGGYSRRGVNPKHNLRLEFDTPLDYPVFAAHGATTFTTLDLRTEQNISWQYGDSKNTMLREEWTRNTQAATGDPALRSRSVNLFLNGQYWGVYQLEDRLDSDGAAYTYGGAPNDYDIIKNADDLGYDIVDGDDDEWRQLWSLTADQVVSDDEYSRIAELVDVDNLADFQLINAYAANKDAAPSTAAGYVVANNWIAMRSPTRKFQFVINDAEFTLGADDHDVAADLTFWFPVLDANPFYSEHYFNPGWLHQALLSNAQYRAVVADRAAVLIGGVLDPTAAAGRWAALKATIASVVWAEAARWGWTRPGVGPFTAADWTTETRWVETNWFPQRTAIFAEQVTAWTRPRPVLVRVVVTAAATAYATRVDRVAAWVTQTAEVPLSRRLRGGAADL